MVTETHLLNIIDTKTFKHNGDITLSGRHSEAMSIDRKGKKLYVILSSTNEIGVVDLDTRELLAKWPVPEAEVENSMALDEANHRLFIATGKPPKFFVFDTDSGKVVTVLPCAGLNDEMWFDSGRKRIYVTGTDVASVFRQSDADHYEQNRGSPDRVPRQDIGIRPGMESSLHRRVRRRQGGR